VKSTRTPLWHVPAEQEHSCVKPGDLCSPLGVGDLLIVQQTVVLVCLIEAGLVRALTLLSSGSNQVRARVRLVLSAR
jgi:hypothetical protein